MATLAGGVAAVAVGVAIDRFRPPPAAVEQRSGAAVWLVLLGALAMWELASFVQRPRSQHPTLSSLANDVLRNHPARALAMFAWLVLGVRIVRR